MISKKHKFIFVHMGKTGGNSIQEALAQYSEDQITSDKDREDGVERFNVVNARLGTTKHSTLPEYIDALGQDWVDDAFVFTAVRHPWDRLMSEFYYGMEFIVNLQPGKNIEDLELPEFNRDRFLYEVSRSVNLEQMLFEKMPKGPIDFIEDTALDYVMHTENLQADFDKVMDTLGLPRTKLNRRNRTKRMDYKTNYDNELIETVRQKYRREIEYFGYEFDKLEPTKPGRVHLKTETSNE